VAQALRLRMRYTALRAQAFDTIRAHRITLMFGLAMQITFSAWTLIMFSAGFASVKTLGLLLGVSTVLAFAGYILIHLYTLLKTIRLSETLKIDSDVLGGARRVVPAEARDGPTLPVTSLVKRQSKMVLSIMRCHATLIAWSVLVVLPLLAVLLPYVVKATGETMRLVRDFEMSDIAASSGWLLAYHSFVIRTYMIQLPAMMCIWVVGWATFRGLRRGTNLAPPPTPTSTVQSSSSSPSSSPSSPSSPSLSSALPPVPLILSRAFLPWFLVIHGIVSSLTYYVPRLVFWDNDMPWQFRAQGYIVALWCLVGMQFRANALHRLDLARITERNNRNMVGNVADSGGKDHPDSRSATERDTEMISMLPVIVPDDASSLSSSTAALGTPRGENRARHSRSRRGDDTRDAHAHAHAQLHRLHRPPDAGDNVYDDYETSYAEGYGSSSSFSRGSMAARTRFSLESYSGSGFGSGDGHRFYADDGGGSVGGDRSRAQRGTVAQPDDDDRRDRDLKSSSTAAPHRDPPTLARGAPPVPAKSRAGADSFEPPVTVERDSMLPLRSWLDRWNLAVAIVFVLALGGFYQVVVFPYYARTTQDSQRVLYRVLYHNIIQIIAHLLMAVILKHMDRRRLLRPYLFVLIMRINLSFAGRFLLSSVESFISEALVTLALSFFEVFDRASAPLQRVLVHMIVNKSMDFKAAVDAEGATTREEHAVDSIFAMVTEVVATIFTIGLGLAYHVLHGKDTVMASIVSAGLSLGVQLGARVLTDVICIRLEEKFLRYPIMVLWYLHKREFLIITVLFALPGPLLLIDVWCTTLFQIDISST
jgi:hypothetical protein